MATAKAYQLLCLVLLFIPGCTSSTGVENDLHRESEHFLFESTRKQASESEISDGIALAEDLFTRISAIVGEQRTPTEKIRVVLEGDQTTRGSYLDFDGLHLYRYPTHEGGYWATFAHELVHAFGAAWFIAHAAWNWPTYRFFDEGFAEFVAQEVDPTKYGFPFFGFPEDVIAGHWILSGLFIPFSTLRAQHDRLNSRCDLQAYTSRASWFRHVDLLLGRDALLQLVYPEEEPTTEMVQRQLGISLEELDQGWQSWIVARYQAEPDAITVVRGYTARTPWYEACARGVDF